MNKFFILLFVFFLFSFTIKAQNISKPNFIKEFHNYKTDTSIQVTVLYKNRFYCLELNHQVFVVDAETNLIDHNYSDNSKEVQIENLYLKNDTLFGKGDYHTYFLNKQNKWISLPKGYYHDDVQYEDDNYVITSTCSGEWGGSLYLKDKRTGKLYECICQCAVNIIKDKNVYDVTASIDHMSGFANIFQIKDPEDLKLYNRDALLKKQEDAKKKNQRYIGTIGEDESDSRQGTNQLIDSIGISLATSFIVKSQIYYITEKDIIDGKGLFHKAVNIAMIKDGKLVPIEDLTKLNIWSFEPANRNNKDYSLFTFDNIIQTGFIYIKQNKLSFYFFDKKYN